LHGANPVVTAERIFRELVGVPTDDHPAPTHDEFLYAVRRFSVIAFEVPDSPDSDGFLFEYGTFRWIPEPGFVVGVVRQFEIPKDSGDLDHYVQLRAEYRYAIEPDLEALRDRQSWWFRDDSTPFEEWYLSVVNDPVWDALRGRPVSRFEVSQESV
jgi:hypothetical protein